MKSLNDEDTGAIAALPPRSRTRPFTKSELRKEDRQRTSERVEKSATMAVTFPGLKTLAVNLIYFDREYRFLGTRYPLPGEP